MRNIHRRDTKLSLQSPDLLLKSLTQPSVERCQRLIHNQDTRLEYQRPRKGNALLLPATQALRGAIPESGKTHHGEYLVHT